MDESVVVSTDWLAERLLEAQVRVVDVREEWEFDGIGHIPGAVNIPFEAYRDPSDAHPGTLPGREAFASLISRAGIERGDTIVVYDDMFGVFAARFYVTALVYGHDDVRLLDGDYSAWARMQETSTDSPTVESTEYVPRPLEPTESPLIDLAAVDASISSGDVTILDTRTRAEFERAHLPGAVRFDWRSVVDTDTRELKPETELEELFAAVGVRRDRPVILYCNTARRISHTYVVLSGLSYSDVWFYEGSLTEWQARGQPVETGSDRTREDSRSRSPTST